MNKINFERKMIEFISKETKNKKIDKDTILIGSGIIDSLMLTSLILFVEDSLNCEIEIDDFSIETFNTIEIIYEKYSQNE